MVSVCMATYNGGEFIYDQISSVLPQLSFDDELIISDDGSQDETISIIQSFNDPRIRLFRNKSNIGVVKNFENALIKAQGDYIFLCDQDDVWFNNKVQLCCELLKEFDIVVSDCHIVDRDLNIVEPSYFDYLNSRAGLFRNLSKNTYLGCCLCFKRLILKLIIPFPEKIPMHDIWIGFVGGLFYKVRFEPIPMMLYRRHSYTFTHKKVGQSRANLIGKINNRINQIRYVPLLLLRRLF
jgi:glycosyltransferase involved in cell wall biosynthesis